MKKFKTIGVLVFIITAFIACNTKNKEDIKKKSPDEKVYYTCSMDPQVTEDKPGKCPICHMDLVPIKSTISNSNDITLSEQQIKLGNITTQTVSEVNSSEEQSYTGILTINQEKIKTISVRSMGRIEKLFFKTVGEYVRPGRLAAPGSVSYFRLQAAPARPAKQSGLK